MKLLPALVIGWLAATVRADTHLAVWGAPQGPDSIAIAQAFELKHPHVRVRMLGMGVGQMNPQKLLTAIVGGCPPDLVYQGRFNICDWASRGAFIALDDLLARDWAATDCPRREDYYDAAWSEDVFAGHVFGVPTEADDRALYWNRGMFRQKRHQLEMAGLDWQRAPRTWSELLRYSKVLTEKGKCLGFIPNFGNAWLYLYAFQTGATFLSPDGRQCTLASPEAAEALDFMRQGYEVVGGYSSANVFQSGFQDGENDPFIAGRVAMKIDGDWSLAGLARYGLALDFAVAPPPTPDDRYARTGRFAGVQDRFVTWTGGWCYAMPRGCPHRELAWQFMKFATSLEGRLIGNRALAMADRAKGRVYIPRIQGLKAANEVLYRLYRPADPRFAEAIKVHIGLMNVSRVRPPTKVGQLLWDAHVRATEETLLGKASALAALTVEQQTVQRELDLLNGRHRYPVVSMAWMGGIAFLAFLVALGVSIVSWRKARLGRLARHEARWGYLCIAPWVIGFLVLTVEPMLASLFFSFTDYDVLSPPRWVGARNYLDMVGPDHGNVLKAFGNAAYLAGVGVPLGIVSGLAVALLLNSGVRGIRFYRLVFYLPAIVPVAASSVLWIWLLTPDTKQGLINSLWSSTIGTWLSLPSPGWLTAEAWAKPALILMGVWGAGSGMVLWLAGLKGVPSSLYEAAEIDGASPVCSFRNVTLPMLSPVLFFNIVMGFIGAIQEFDRVYIMSPEGTNGPSDSLLVPAKYLFTNAFTYFKIGYASALAWTILAVILLITLVQFRLARFWVHEETGK
ncbi:MAG: extracellular solute-binding protein [Fimbriimonas sp.]|nr:extracellular solute-binding protein [Fimbriimonas sp.]